jgi:hypothetical protein
MPNSYFLEAAMGMLTSHSSVVNRFNDGLGDSFHAYRSGLFNIFPSLLQILLSYGPYGSSYFIWDSNHHGLIFCDIFLYYGPQIN